jgi:hypothetical protein
MGTISEIFEGDPPYLPWGRIAQVSRAAEAFAVIPQILIPRAPHPPGSLRGG